MSESSGRVNSVSTQNSIPGHVLIRLSRQSLYNHFVARDMDAAFEYMSEHVDWLGPFNCQVASSLQEMRELLTPEYDTKLSLTNEQWKAKCYGNVWVVSAVYTVLSQVPGDEAMVPFHQHATYVWARTSEGPRIVHLHVSNVTDDNAVAPPLPLGMNAVQFLFDNSDAYGTRGAKLEFRDIEGNTRFLHRNEILCVLSEGPRCRIRYTQGEFVMRGSLEGLAERLGGRFVRTHRSCLANKGHAVGIEGSTLRLDDGFACPISKSHLADMRSLIGASAR